MPPLYAAALVVMLQIVALGAVFPTLQGYTAQLGGGVMWGGLLFAAVTAPKFILNPIWGRFSDRVGRKRAIGVLFVGTIGGSVLWALAPALGNLAGGALLWLTVSRVFVGLFTAQATVAFAIASDVTTPEKRAGAMGVLGAAFGIGLLIGIPLGGIVAEHSFAAVGWLCAGFEAAALLVAMLLLKETHRPTDAATSPRLTELLTMAGRPEFRTLLIATACTWAGGSVLISTIEPLARLRYAFDPKQVGWVMGLWGLTGVVVQGGVIRPVVARLGERTTAIVGLVILMLGFAGLCLHETELHMWLLMVPIGAGGALAGPALVALISRRAGSHEQGRIHGLNQSATSLGRAIGMFGGAAIFEFGGVGWAYLSAFVLCNVAALLLRFESSVESSPIPSSPK